MGKRLSRFVSDSLKSGQFRSQSGLSNDGCSCSSLYMILYANSGLFISLPLCVVDNYINSLRGFCVACSTVMGSPEPQAVEQAEPGSTHFHS